MKNKKSKQHPTLSWRPIRKGIFYCSPACGGNCTRSAFNSATKCAEDLKKFLDNTVGGKWRTHVWENLGWHCEVVQGTLSIHIHHNYGSPDSYMIMNAGDSDHPGVGHTSLTVRHPRSKNQLVIEIRKALKEHYDFVKRVIDAYNTNKHMKGFSHH